MALLFNVPDLNISQFEKNGKLSRSYLTSYLNFAEPIRFVLEIPFTNTRAVLFNSDVWSDKINASIEDHIDFRFQIQAKSPDDFQIFSDKKSNAPFQRFFQYSRYAFRHARRMALLQYFPFHFNQ